MAHPEDLEILRQGPKAWNAWRQENPDHIPDLRDAELTMSQRQFGPANGGPIDLSDSDLQGMVLRHSTLTDALLMRANLVATDLVQARLEDADLTGADLTDAVLDYSDLTGAILDGAVLVGTSLVNVTGLTQEQIQQTHGDASTALPAYLLPPESWFPPLEGSMFEEYDSQIDLSPLSNDPYEVLGIGRDATFDQIRTSFRTLVKKLHPDLNPDDTVAQERFKRVSIAYRILGDPVKRDRYNRGEIDANGDIHPEFEAKKEFRRYAYKFYAAAVASLLLAAGILGAVWHTFWLQEINISPDNMQITAAGPPKLTERLRLSSQKRVSEPAQPITSVEKQQVAPAVADGQAVASAKIAAVAAAVEASKKLTTDGDQIDTAAEVQSAGGYALRSGQQSAQAIPNGVAPEQSPYASTYDDVVSNVTGAEPVVELTFPRTSEDASVSSAAPPLSPASETNAVKPALSNGRSSNADQQGLTEYTPGEAVKISQSLSGNTAETASIIEDENNKLVTLIKDIKTLAVAKPSLFPTYRPRWPSAVNVILRFREEASLADDDITDVFRRRTKAQLEIAAQKSRMAMTANSLPVQLDSSPVTRDSLQIPREKKQAKSEIAAAKPNFIDSDFELESSRTVPINSHDVNIIRLRPMSEESVVIQLP